MNRYQKKPVVIDAVQWTGNNLDEIMEFCAGNATYELMARGNSELVISTLEDGNDKIAQHVASCGDWVIRGIQGEYYPCKPDIFEASYERSALSTKLQEPVGLKLIPVAVKFLDEAFTEIRQWSGSAFLADEAVEDEAACKSQLYDFLCSHGNVIQSIADDLRTLAHQPVTAGWEKAIAALTDYQQQLDQDGIMVGVSREALEMVLAALKSEGRK